jgi:sulfite reductase (NADPH) hemoprotein beta-component
MAAAPKRPPLPAILLANDLLDGDVVFASAAAGALSWTRDPALALVAADDAAAAGLESFAAAELAGNRVVDAYLVDVEIRSGAPVPRHFRERFKTLGPSNRPDLGKQAGDGIENGRRA